MRFCGRCNIRRVVFGEFEAACEEGLADGVPVLGGHEDKVCVVGCDEEDGNSGHG